MITAFYASVLALIYLGLSAFVVAGRFKYGVSLGDGGQEDMSKRIRAHANFIEYIPLALILMMVMEMQAPSTLLLHVMGFALVACRMSHVFGITSPKPVNIFRMIGAAGTMLVIAVAAIWCLVMAPPVFIF